MKPEQLGPYKLEKVIGRGGMGAVYAGRNQETGERAAVKVLSPVLADDASFRERFKAEVETLKKLLHPNIVQLFGYGEQEDYLFYVMELVEGRSLQDELLAGRRFHWREAARIGIDIAHALKHAHDRGIIHRDLKPANLLIDSHDHVKLTDFGIAKLYGGMHLTSDGGVLGTADYMSPEQAEGKQVTSRCDLYSLGSVLYALLAGRPPFSGKTLPEVIQGLRFEKAIPIRRLNLDVPEEFETIIQQLLEKDPQKRIPTAVAVANRLKAMEHALSMETQIASPIDLDDEADGGEPGPAAPAARPPAGVTAPLGPQTGFSTEVRPTIEMEAGDGEQPRKASVPLAPQSAVKKRAAEVTLAGSSTAVAGGEEDADLTLAEPAAKKTIFTTVSQAELRRAVVPHDADEHSWSSWIWTGVLLAAVVAVLGGLTYYASRPPSADALYAQIRSAAEQGGEELQGVEFEIERFRKLFPEDPRRQEMDAHLEEIELFRLQQTLRRESNRFASGEGASPVVRPYLEAVRVQATDPEAALGKFRALVDLFGNAGPIGKSAEEQQTNSRCLDLARRQVERLENSLAKTIADERELVRQRLAEAEKLAASDAAAAERIWRGIVSLYADKQWAAELVAEARQKLEE